MSQFDSFNDACYRQAAAVFGMVRFFLDGEEYEGIFNEHQSQKESSEYGPVYQLEATLMVAAELFDDLPTPVENWLNRKVITIDGRSYEVSQAQLDTLTYTISLTTPASKQASA